MKKKKTWSGKIKNLSLVLGVKVRSRLVLENDQNIKFSTKVFDLDDEIGNWLAFLWSKLHELKTASSLASCCCCQPCVKSFWTTSTASCKL